MKLLSFVVSLKVSSCLLSWKVSSSHLELSSFNVKTEEVDCCGSDGEEKGVEGEALEGWRVRNGG